MDSLEDEVKKFYEYYNQILANEGWDKAPFLKIMHAKLLKLKLELDELVGFDSQLELERRGETSPQPISDGFIKLFIYLYTTEGKKVEAWQRLLANLDKQYISRPIYRHEADAQYAVFNAPVVHNAGYVAVWVEKKFLLEPEVGPQDKFGHELLMLKDRAVDLTKIDYFWTNTSQYQWKLGKLIFSKLSTRLEK